MNEMNHYDQRLNHVENQLSDLASDVRALTGAVSQSTANQRALAERFDRMADLFEAGRGQAPEWSTKDVIGIVVGAVFAVALATGSLFYGLAAYVDTQNGPIADQVAGLEVWKTDKDEFQREMHHEVGINRTVQDQQDKEITRLWNHVHKLEEEDKEMKDRISQNDSEIEAARVSRRAIGDYAKEHVQMHDPKQSET